MTQMEGVDKSLWVATTPETNFPKLAEDQEVYDLAIVGGGITGVAAAHFAQEKGLKAVLVERNRLVEWTTGGTTAKLSSQHYLIYDYLINRHGESTARAFADANECGIDAVERISTELGIDAEFARRDAYVFTRQNDRLDRCAQRWRRHSGWGCPRASRPSSTFRSNHRGGEVRQPGQFHHASSCSGSWTVSSPTAESYTRTPTPRRSSRASRTS